MFDSDVWCFENPRNVWEKASYISVHLPHLAVCWSASERLDEHIDDLLNAAWLRLERPSFHLPGLVPSVVALSLSVRSLMFEPGTHIRVFRSC